MRFRERDGRGIGFGLCGGLDGLEGRGGLRGVGSGGAGGVFALRGGGGDG